MVILTPREKELVDGLLDPDRELKQIAFDMGITYATAKYYLANLYQKLRAAGYTICGDRTLVIWAVTHRQTEQEKEYQFHDVLSKLAGQGSHEDNSSVPEG